MNAIFRAAVEVEAICRAADFKFCFIGGLPLLALRDDRDTEPRLRGMLER
jgi:hypothetical protein